MSYSVIIATPIKNNLLEGIRAYSASGVTNFRFGAYPSGGTTGDEISTSTGFAYNIPSGGSMSLPNNIVINVPAGAVVGEIWLLKNTTPNQWLVFKEVLPQTETFTYAGSITITSATISLVDA